MEVCCSSQDSVGQRRIRVFMECHAFISIPGNQQASVTKDGRSVVPHFGVSFAGIGMCNFECIGTRRLGDREKSVGPRGQIAGTKAACLRTKDPFA
eukprot:557045-Pelagomonas_calceolata.AAC.3